MNKKKRRKKELKVTHPKSERQSIVQVDPVIREREFSVTSDMPRAPTIREPIRVKLPRELLHVPTNNQSFLHHLSTFFLSFFTSIKRIYINKNSLNQLFGGLNFMV